MLVITIDEIKANSRIDTTDDDTLLEEIGQTAEDMVENMTRSTWTDIYTKYGKYPAPLKRACLMLADHLYTHRGAVSPMSMNLIPYGVATMVKPYVIFS